MTRITMQTQSFPPAPVPTSAAASPIAIKAVVQIGAMEAGYLRAGKGETVLLLLPHGLAAESQHHELFSALATHLRVIAPEVPPWIGAAGAGSHPANSLPFAGWLRNVIDGLGLGRPNIVVDEALVATTLGFALLDPERVQRLAVIARDHADPAILGVATRGVLDRFGPAFLVLRVDAGADASTRWSEAAAEITRFVTDGEGTYTY
jgi:pimeloyl-ACP methyl ester carboxylesterase